jgi:hypothetical protein
MAAAGLQRSSKPADESGGGSTELDKGLVARSWWHAITEEDGRAVSRRRTVVALKRLGSNGLKNRLWWGEKREDLRVEAFYASVCNYKNFSKSFHRSWVFFLARLRGFGGYDHGSWTDKRWMIFQQWLFENLDCSRKLYFYLINLAGGRELMLRDVKIGSKRPGRQWWSEQTFMKKRKTSKRFPQLLCTKDNLVWELQNNLTHTLNNLWILVLMTLFSAVQWFLKVGVMHMLMKTRCTCSCGMALVMQFSMTRFPTSWNSDCKGNHRQRKGMCRESYSHN